MSVLRYRNMEAEDYNFDESKSPLLPGKMITTAWGGDWESFKQKFEATADLNGLNEAVMVGQLVAEGKVNWPWTPIKNETNEKAALAECVQGVCPMYAPMAVYSAM